MAALNHRTFGEFDQGREDWVSYCERLEQHFAAHEVTDAGKQRAILLSVCGATTYQLMRNLVAPGKPAEKSFGELVTLVKEHLTPPPSEIMQRFTFNTRSQKEGETVAQFVAELRRLSEHCAHGETVDAMLRDRLVCGMRDSRAQRRLLAETSLTFKKAFELAQASEMAEKNARDLQKPIGVVHAVRTQQSPKPRLSLCYRCEGKHAPHECLFKEADCHNCGKKGHLARVSQQTQTKQTTAARRKYNERPTRFQEKSSLGRW